MNSFRFPNLQAWPRSRRGLEQHQPVHPHSPCWHSSQGKRWEKGIGYSRINCCHFSSLAFFASSRCLWSCWNRWSSAATATHLCGATRNWLFCGVFGGCQLRGYDLRPQTTIKSQQISKIRPKSFVSSSANRKKVSGLYINWSPPPSARLRCVVSRLPLPWGITRERKEQKKPPLALHISLNSSSFDLGVSGYHRISGCFNFTSIYLQLFFCCECYPTTLTNGWSWENTPRENLISSKSSSRRGG